jgi:hypothetical protein
VIVIRLLGVLGLDLDRLFHGLCANQPLEVSGRIVESLFGVAGQFRRNRGGSTIEFTPRAKHRIQSFFRSL